MAFARFSIIVSTDAKSGIAQKCKMPWHSTSDMKFFRETTVGRGKNVVIMGRKTYQTIPTGNRPLKNRKCCVLSRTWKQEENFDIAIFSSIPTLLTNLGATRKRYDHIYVIGGESVYRQFIEDYLYLCDKIYVTKFRDSYECDQFFPWDTVKEFRNVLEPAIFHTHTRYSFAPDVAHDEYLYLQLLKDIVKTGEVATDNCGVRSHVLFGKQIRFDLQRSLPILTTKKLDFEKTVKELLFFLHGETDTRVLEEQKISSWTELTSAQKWKDKGFDFASGETGPFFGHQWRRAGATYTGKREYSVSGNHNQIEGIDQLTDLLRRLKTRPYSRRHLVLAWSPTEVDSMVSLPNDFAFQVNVSGNGKFLDALVYVRSCDCFFTLPELITRYAILTEIIAVLSELQPRSLILSLGSAFLNCTSFHAVAQQVVRDPKPFPKIEFASPRNLRRLEDLTCDTVLI